MDWQDVLPWGVMHYLTVPEAARLRRASRLCSQQRTVLEHVVPRWCTPEHYEHLALLQHGRLPCDPVYELARRERNVALELFDGNVLCVSMHMRSAPLLIRPDNTVHNWYLGARGANQHCVKPAGPGGVVVATMCSVRLYRPFGEGTWAPILPQMATTHLASHRDSPWVYGCTHDGLYRFDHRELRARMCVRFAGLSFAASTADHVVIVPCSQSRVVLVLRHDAVDKPPVVLDTPGTVVDVHSLRHNRVLLVCARSSGIYVCVLDPTSPRLIEWTPVQIRNYPIVARWCVLGDLFLTPDTVIDLASMRVVFSEHLRPVTTGVCSEHRCCLFTSDTIRFYW